MTGPLISIGVPTYNRPAGLRDCLEGLLGQSYANLQIVVSDNASSDPEVATVMREFAARDARVRCFRQPENRGAFFNFQFVLEQAAGEFFMWAADDDRRDQRYVETLAAQLVGHPDAALAFCDFAEVDEAGTPVPGYPAHLALLRPFAESRRWRRLIAYFFQLESNGKANLVYGLARRSALAGVDWPDMVRRRGAYGADMLLVFLLLRRGRLALVEQRLYHCTVGNSKDHTTRSAPGWRAKLAVPFAAFGRQLRYSAQYPAIAGGLLRPVLWLCWPFKAMDIFARLFLAGEIRNMRARIRRWHGA